MSSILQSYLASCIKEKNLVGIADWASGYLKIPSSTRYPIFDVHESFWWKEPLDAFCDPEVRRIDIRGPVGSAKSLCGEIIIAWIIEHAPGPVYYVWQSDEDGKDAMEDRLLPMLEANDCLSKKLPVEKNKRRVCKIMLPTMPLYVVGANPNNAQSKRIKYLIMEEPHLYEQGMLRAFEGRTEGVRGTKIVTLSTGSVLHDDSDRAFMSGSQHEWQVPCPHCNQYQPPIETNETLKGERNEKTIDPDGNWRWGEYLKTLKYHCVHCGKPWPADENFRKQQSWKGKYVQKNFNCRPDHRSFHIESCGIHWTPYATIIEEKVKAVNASKRGNLEDLREYVQKRKGNAWDESPPGIGEKDVTRLTGAHHKGDAWSEAISLFLTFDNQAGKSRLGEGEHRWYTCWGFSESEMRLIDEGRITTWEECEELRMRLKVEARKTFVDIAYDTARCHSICCRYGWRGLWGDNKRKEAFPHHERKQDGSTITRYYPFSAPMRGHRQNSPQGMQESIYFSWSHATIAQLYHTIKDGMSSYKMVLPVDVSTQFLEHQNAEHKQKSIDKKGRPVHEWIRNPNRDDHLLDCSEMALVAALMSSTIRNSIYGANLDLAPMRADED